MQKIIPFLWFDNNAEEAINFYRSVFKDTKLLSKNAGPDGKLLTAMFQLEGQTFYALNGGPRFKFTEAISLFVNCESQAEVDELWETLSAGGAQGHCGWLKDKYGLSWQIIPTALGKLMSDPDPVKAGRVAQAMLQMTRIDIQALQRAYDQ